MHTFPSTALGTHADNFVKCPSEALEWNTRRFRILEEITSYNPHIICLQVSSCLEGECFPFSSSCTFSVIFSHRVRFLFFFLLYFPRVYWISVCFLKHDFFPSFDISPIFLLSFVMFFFFCFLFFCTVNS